MKIALTALFVALSIPSTASAKCDHMYGYDSAKRGISVNMHRPVLTKRRGARVWHFANCARERRPELVGYIRRLRAWRRTQCQFKRTNRALGRCMNAKRGWASQWPCLHALWNRESRWLTWAHNPSGAHGIPQALPGSKMGPGWQYSATVQIRWGLSYIAGRYGSPCNANAAQAAKGWY